MTSLPKMYIREFKQKLGMLAIWDPYTLLAVGDVGIMQASGFEKRTTLADKRISFKVKEEPYQQGSLTFMSAGAIDINANAQKEGAALVSISFRRGGATYLSAEGCQKSVASGIDRLGTEIIDLYNRGRWEKPWCVVTEVIRCARATILVSASDRASFEAECRAEDPLRLASAEGALAIKREHEIGLSILNAVNLTPLFIAHGVQTNIFSDAQFLTRGTDSKSTVSGPPTFGPVDYPDDDQT